MIFRNFETKIKIEKKNKQRTGPLDRPQVAGVAQLAPQMIEAGPRHQRSERVH
jgi:hypothetical protein